MSDVSVQTSEVRCHQELKEACCCVVPIHGLLHLRYSACAPTARLAADYGTERMVQGKACACLARNAEKLKSKTLKTEVIIFAYSYAAREIFRFAKQQGWKTVSDRSIPVRSKRKIVAEEAARVPELADDGSRLRKILGHWQEECSLADHIIVNSEWSRTCLEKAGVMVQSYPLSRSLYESR